jgi:hypothetical protein
VEHWTAEANQGRFEVHILGYHLAGEHVGGDAGELAGSHTLWGELPRPTYPQALRRAAPPSWLRRANRELDYATYWAASENPVSCAGALAKVTVQAAHARLAHRGVWALNEKRMIQWAELSGLYPRFAALGSSRDDLGAAIDDLASTVRAIETEVTGQA